MAGISILCLLIAFALHAYGWKKGAKNASLASEPVHKFPGLRQMYDLAEARVFDLYEQGVKFIQGLSWVLFKGVDRPIDFFFEKVVTAVGRAFTGIMSKAHNGQYANYLAWSVGGLVVVASVIVLLMK